MNALAMARKKTKLMSQVRAELLYCKATGEYTSKRREKLFGKLWDMNMMFQDFARVAQEYDYTIDDYKKQCIDMEMMGIEREGEDYVPLAIISFARPLAYMASHKAEFEAADEAGKRDMVQEALDILNGSYAEKITVVKPSD